MKVVEDYLKRDLGRMDLSSWDEIRRAYAERAFHLVSADYQSPSYRTSGPSQAGRRTGKIIATINDYTRDQHDLSQRYETLFATQYLPRMGTRRPRPFVTNSGMAALTTLLTLIHKLHGHTQTILVGAHSYFQNREALEHSFDKVLIFEERDEKKWQLLIENEEPLAIFVDTMCNVADLVATPVAAIARTYHQQKGTHYLVVDNSLTGPSFPWQPILRERTREFVVAGWESLNKYHQFGMDRTMGGILWVSDTQTSDMLFHARMDAGTILSDIQTAMLPTPNKKVMKEYQERLHRNGELMAQTLGAHVDDAISITRADTGYGWNGPHVTVQFEKKETFASLQRKITRMIFHAKKEGIELVAGSSFGMPVTRVYVTGRQARYTEMFFRISCGTEDEGTLRKIADIIASNL